MNSQRRLTTAALLVGLLADAACGRGAETTASPATTNPPASTPAAPAEPIFKPVDPATIPPPPQTPSNASPPTAPLPGGGGEPAAMVTDLASGWPVNLRVGQSMVARLTADRASGARWSLRSGSDGGVVTLAGEPTYETKPGEASMEVFRLTAAKPGQTKLTFELRKGPEAVALKSASYQVTVQ
jgi:predicted secreted protein